MKEWNDLDLDLYLACIYVYIAELIGLHGIKSAMDIVVYFGGYCCELWPIT